MSNLIIEWLAIAGQFLPGLVIFLVGLLVGHILSSWMTQSGKRYSRLLSRVFRFTLTALVVAIALQQLNVASCSLKLAPRPIKAAFTTDYKTNIPLGKANVAIGGGGYVTGIYLHPKAKDLVYIRTDIGGFYRWNAAQERWIPLTDHFPMQQSNYYGGEGLALDPNNPDIVYIAAGKFSADWWPHKGTIFKSNDKGETWKKLNIDVKMGGNEELRWAGERLVVNPFNSKMIFFGSRSDGLWKSSNAGATWTKVTSFPGKLKQGMGILGIVFDNKLPGLIYVNAYEDGIYRSTDSGDTWNKIPESPTRAMRMAVSSDSTLYVTSETSPQVVKYVKGAWQNITPKNSQAGYNGLSINPTNPNDVLVSTREKSDDTNIHRSLDGGATWTEQKRSTDNTVPWWSNYMLSNPAISAIEFDPNIPGRVWLTDWYGIWRTENISTNPSVWTNYVKGHEETVIFTLVSPPSGSLLLSGMADVDGFYHDNGLDTYPSKRLSESGPDFQDTYSIAYSESNPLRMVRVGGKRWNNTYTGATSTDGGRTWKEFASFPKDTMPMRVAVSATNPDVFVVITSGSQALHTTDGGASWKQVKGLPDGIGGPWNWSLPLAADPVDGDTFYYYAKGKVYRSNDGGASFALMNESLPTEHWHSLKTVPGTKGEVWLAVDGDGFYRSTDAGKTFSKIPKVEKAYLFAFGKPKTGSTSPALYMYGKIAGMGDGIFSSLDQGKTWTRIGDRSRPIGNDPTVMEASKQKFGLVFIGTNGRGIYYGTQ